MLFLHETHDVIGTKAAEFEEAMKRVWMPALARGDGARLLWYMDLAHGISFSHKVITITGLRDGGVWEDVAQRVRRGDLAEPMRQLDRCRHDVVGKMLLPADWSPGQQVDLNSVPTDPDVTHEQSMWLVSMGWPFGPLEEYLKLQEEKWYKPLKEGNAKVRLWVDLQFFFEVAPGSGPKPEFVFWEKITEDRKGIVHSLLATELPPEMSTKDAYMIYGLTLRDQWECQILRSSNWSPLY